MAVDQWQSHDEVLGQPDRCVVDRVVAVRVQPAHDLADHAGALHVRTVGAQPHLGHLVQDAALNGLQAVPDVREGALVDHRVGVLEVTAAHLVGDVDVDDVLFEVLWRWGCRSASCHAVILPWAEDYWGSRRARRAGFGSRSLG